MKVFFCVMNDSKKNSKVWGVTGFTSCLRTKNMSITVTFQLSDRERALFLEELKGSSQKPCEREDVLNVKRENEEECDKVRVVWLGGKEYITPWLSALTWWLYWRNSA